MGVHGAMAAAIDFVGPGLAGARAGGAVAGFEGGREGNPTRRAPPARHTDPHPRPPPSRTVQSCCATLAKYYGPNSTLPSRNCWCVPEFYAQQAEYALVNYIDIPTYMASCE